MLQLDILVLSSKLHSQMLLPCFPHLEKMRVDLCPCLRIFLELLLFLIFFRIEGLKRLIHVSVVPILNQSISTIIGETKDMVAEGSVEIEGKSGGNTNFKFVLGSWVRNDFPVVLTRMESIVGNCCSENIGRFFEHN